MHFRNHIWRWQSMYISSYDSSSSSYASVQVGDFEVSDEPSFEAFCICMLECGWSEILELIIWFRSQERQKETSQLERGLVNARDELLTARRQVMKCLYKSF